MPTVLRRPSDESPGIITVTHNEALWGVPATSPRVRDLLNQTVDDGRWVYGVHVQGDCSFLPAWPLASWQGFVMWPDAEAAFISNLSTDQRIDMNCINFMPADYSTAVGVPAVTDVVVVSRASAIKGIRSTVDIVRELLTIRSNTNITIIVPDPRRWKGLRRAPKGTDLSFFETARQSFTSKELRRISFISSSQEAFGQFPLSQPTMIQILASSRIVLLNSESEGTPRILAEGLLLGKPCAVPQALTCGLDPYLNDSNCLRLSPSGVLAAAELSCALDNPASMAVDRGAMRRAFSEEVHKPLLMERLSRMYGDAAEEAWELDDLHTRLACHGEKQNYQIMNSERAFLDWFARVEAALSVGGKMDEDTLFPNDRPADRVRTSTYLTRQAQRVKRVIALKRASVG